MNTRTSISDLFTREEITELTTKSDLHGSWAVLSTWAVIGGTFAAVASTWEYLPVWGKLLMCIAALVILAGRQLALAIIMHDASHQSLFKTKWLNDIATDWLCARPIWNDLKKYRAHHLRHHSKTSTVEDPDLSLVEGFPTSKKSLMRKFFRDVSGITGLKFALGRVLMDVEKMEWTVSNDRRWISQEGRHWVDYPKAFLKNSGGAIATNTALFSILWAAGHPKLYALWILAYLTPFPLFLRVRSMAEHAGMPTSNSALTNTRSTKAGYIARALVAPIHVNFHKEHHLMATVPYFKLPKMHQMLLERGHVPEPPSYWQVLNELSDQAD
ncbi:fatty acid desaturase family protein [Acinetobacter modestus]|uniref:fatty acid desaturase family protein n=1 Tax=Acinetobacter modestus TaxID=1776740 RepID=UPI001F4B02F8|nr:fatty acid desaturase family protein [Acinetobacter modestus]MCH7330301.1 fatty acid desaturase family protein [Acinetobacter modestus]